MAERRCGACRWYGAGRECQAPTPMWIGEVEMIGMPWRIDRNSDAAKCETWSTDDDD